ncbi:MAG: SGNH/GDSL hydrolase family protein [Sediminibacterium sp.]
MAKHHFTYLALGDSYTIGESVPLHENFPYQTVQLLRKAGLHFQAPEIIAQTGWTSAELAEHLIHTKLNDQYDFITLLIGVNNQYRGLSAADFKTDLAYLVKKAIHLSGNHPDHVMVLSIPDWGATPYAAKKDQTVISREINEFNLVCEAAAAAFKANYINITEDTRKAKGNAGLSARDHLHYSGRMYAGWAAKITAYISKPVKHFL